MPANRLFSDAPENLLDTEGNPIGELLVWVSDGYLSALEYAWWTDEAPTALPSIARFQGSSRSPNQDGF